MKKFIVYIFFTVLGLLMMKLSGQPMKLEFNEGSIFFNISAKMILALLFYLISFILWTGIVVKNDLSFVVPFSSAIVNLLSVILGVVVFREYLNSYKIIGIAMTIIGLVLMNYR
ncbi:MAG: hypothetical protein GX339_09745 [Tissierellia bacterium]|nr:hypothetical protein [Tissierellia bacterium]